VQRFFRTAVRFILLLCKAYHPAILPDTSKAFFKYYTCKKHHPFALSLSKGRTDFIACVNPFMVRQAHHEPEGFQ